MLTKPLRLWLCFVATALLVACEYFDNLSAKHQFDTGLMQIRVQDRISGENLENCILVSDARVSLLYDQENKLYRNSQMPVGNRVLHIEKNGYLPVDDTIPQYAGLQNPIRIINQLRDPRIAWYSTDTVSLRYNPASPVKVPQFISLTISPKQVPEALYYFSLYWKNGDTVAFRTKEPPKGFQLNGNFQGRLILKVEILYQGQFLLIDSASNAISAVYTPAPKIIVENLQRDYIDRGCEDSFKLALSAEARESGCKGMQISAGFSAPIDSFKTTFSDCLRKEIVIPFRRTFDSQQERQLSIYRDSFDLNFSAWNNQGDTNSETTKVRTILNFLPNVQIEEHITSVLVGQNNKLIFTAKAKVGKLDYTLIEWGDGKKNDYNHGFGSDQDSIRIQRNHVYTQKGDYNVSMSTYNQCNEIGYTQTLLKVYENKTPIVLIHSLDTLIQPDFSYTLVFSATENDYELGLNDSLKTIIIKWDDNSLPDILNFKERRGIIDTSITHTFSPVAGKSSYKISVLAIDAYAKRGEAEWWVQLVP